MFARGEKKKWKLLYLQKKEREFSFGKLKERRKWKFAKNKEKLKIKVYSSRLRQTTIYDLHQLILRNYIATRISSLISAIRGSDHQLGHVTFGDILNWALRKLDSFQPLIILNKFLSSWHYIEQVPEEQKFVKTLVRLHKFNAMGYGFTGWDFSAAEVQLQFCLVNIMIWKVYHREKRAIRKVSSRREKGKVFAFSPDTNEIGNCHAWLCFVFGFCV